MTLNRDLAAEEFRKKYEDAASDWGRGSGAGSAPYYTIEYRAFLDKFMRMNNVRTVVDIGCGDWQFSRFINFDGIHYLGFDIIPSVVMRNIERFGSESVKFAMMPDRLSSLPGADLLIIKDVLQHLPNSEIVAFRDELFPRYKSCLITNSFRKVNTAQNIDIRAGGFRCLDLTAAPFLLDGTYVCEFTSPLWEYIRVLLYRAS